MTGAGVRAATMTFVVYYDEPAIASFLRERITQIAAKHPSRVIVLDGCASPQPVPVPSKPTDLVELGVRDATPRDIDAQVASFQLSDAPLVLAWIAPLSGDQRFTTLAARATTAIVSTSAIASDDSALRDLVAFSRAHPQAAVHDIAYLRLGTWQETISEFFDATNLAHELHDIRSVDVVAGSDAEALYLVGWLASRLSWKPCDHNRFCNALGESIDVTIQREGTARRVSRIVLASSSTTFTAEVHAQDENAIVARVGGTHANASRTLPVTKVDIASLVERAVLHPKADPLFTHTLAAVGQLLAYRRTQ